jgi:hypothetical protein
MLTRRATITGLGTIGAAAALPAWAGLARPDHRVVVAALKGPRECWEALIEAAEEMPTPLWDLVQEVGWWQYEGESAAALEAELTVGRTSRAERVNALWRVWGETSYAEHLCKIADQFA